MRMQTRLAAMGAALVLAGCTFVAEHSAPVKQATTTRTGDAVSADEEFWATFHAGQYGQTMPALERETAAYLADPTDSVSAAHIGWLHIWRLSERRRLTSVPASITDEATLARIYFEQAVALNPKDARYLGFLASATLAEGDIHHDERETRRGYFLLLDAVKAWPEFNLFTAGYVMSTQPVNSERFRQALQWQWDNLDACAGTKVDRQTGAYAQYMNLSTDRGPKRVCWNSGIAPHNFEGFFLNMGDMLVKAGQWQTARMIYGNAKLSPTYAQWPYREILEDRMRDAADNVAIFNATAQPNSIVAKPIMADSTFSCMACHQK